MTDYQKKKKDERDTAEILPARMAALVKSTKKTERDTVEIHPEAMQQLVQKATPEQAKATIPLGTKYSGKGVSPPPDRSKSEGGPSEASTKTGMFINAGDGKLIWVEGEQPQDASADGAGEIVG